jgi:hypothetical protein
MLARLNDSVQAKLRDARRLQCSVDIIWSLICGVVSPAGAAASSRLTAITCSTSFDFRMGARHGHQLGHRGHGADRAIDPE